MVLTERDPRLIWELRRIASVHVLKPHVTGHAWAALTNSDTGQRERTAIAGSGVTITALFLPSLVCAEVVAVIS